MLRILSRLAVGMAVYVVIVLFATSLPLAAGMMLTFPALNGLALYFSTPASIEPIARTMIWMPLINGVLCALYILLFLRYTNTRIADSKSHYHRRIVEVNIARLPFFLRQVDIQSYFALLSKLK